MGDDQQRAAAGGEVAASQSMPSTSRWLVGSSSRAARDSRAGCARAHPPPLAARERRDRRVEALREAAERDAAEQPSSTERNAPSPAHS